MGSADPYFGRKQQVCVIEVRKQKLRQELNLYRKTALGLAIPRSDHLVISMFLLCISRFAEQSDILLLCRDFRVSRHHKHGPSRLKFSDIFSGFLDMEAHVRHVN